ncbi:MAG TPA: MlaE family lipid ABC transporter permease subunit [Alphaproteobacteria bacterium]|nr:MlaE family lipid ABC transporter permease subunit [Alphaproteobacteria bacterium]
MADGGGWFEAKREGGRLVVAAGGRWTVTTLAALDQPLRALAPGGAESVAIDLAALEALDTAGAWVLHRTLKQLSSKGIAADFAHARPEYATLLDQAAHADRRHAPEAPARHPFTDLLVRIGEAAYEARDAAAGLLSFFGLLCLTITRSMLKPARIRFVSVVSHMERTGLDAMPIVGLLSFLIGIVIAYQGADQLKRFGAQVFVVNLIGISVLREMGILLTAIIVAGRSGSAFTAEIGTMKVNEEVDAMVTLGLDPVEVLVLPRTLALVLTLPLLTFYADIMGLLGGCIMSVSTLDLTFSQFLKQLQSAVPIQHFWVGMIKSPVFAFVIAMVGCYEGLNVERSAESVGRLTTKSVVESIFLVIVLDALFSIFFTSINY